MKFHQHLLKWYDHSGRYDLPWQKNQTPYRVWVSEIMLQQTQVNTVIPYFNQFMRRFPSIKSLALAKNDDVLHHWSGLGYYARARNLHKTAKIIHHEHAGRFPKSVEKLEQLPGIGRSTAGAILSLAMNIPAPILDGNVKRVLTRFFTIPGWPGEAKTLKALWSTSEKLTPEHRCRDYNQAMMDLGALVCTRTNPSCHQCPLMSNCQAFQGDLISAFPFKKSQKKRPQKEITMLILQNTHGEVLLQKRPEYGIWGGLWSFPEKNDAHNIEQWCEQKFLYQTQQKRLLKPIKHIFSHFELTIHPVVLTVKTESHHQTMDSNTRVWYKSEDTLPGGIPAPISKLLTLLDV